MPATDRANVLQEKTAKVNKRASGYKIPRITNFVDQPRDTRNIRQNKASMMVSYGAYLVCALALLTQLVGMNAQYIGCRVQNLQRTVRMNGCKVKFVVQACRGACNSKEVHLERSPFVVRLCNCCQSTGNIPVKNLTLRCSTGNVSMTVPSVTSCGCRSCSQRSEARTQLHELVKTFQ